MWDRLENIYKIILLTTVASSVKLLNNNTKNTIPFSALSSNNSNFTIRVNNLYLASTFFTIFKALFSFHLSDIWSNLVRNVSEIYIYTAVLQWRVQGSRKKWFIRIQNELVIVKMKYILKYQGLFPPYLFCKSSQINLVNVSEGKKRI